jgi:DNA-binding MarR family transcriptional regulator
MTEPETSEGGTTASLGENEESQTNKFDWDDLSYVTSSRYRGLALAALNDRPATPSDIAEAADVGIAHVSRALGGLRERGLVELLVSDDTRKDRYYGITGEGSRLFEELPDAKTPTPHAEGGEA